MSRVLMMQVVVDRWTRWYQLREEASLEGIFIGNFMRGGIYDILSERAFTGMLLCGAPGS